MRQPTDTLVSVVRLLTTVTLGAWAVALPPAMTGEPPSAVIVASLAMLVVALVGVESLGWGAHLALAYARATAVEAPLHQPGRVTDPDHHPIRPRAPGA